MSSIAMSTVPATPAWRWPLVTAFAVVVILLLLYRETTQGMVAIWSRSDTFAHCFVVPPIAAWLIWRRRAVLRSLQPSPAPWLSLPMAVLGMLWWLGDLVSANSVMQFALTAMVVATVPTVFGWRVAREMAFPLCFLFLAVPIGEFMTPTLMELTADFTVAALRFSGVPVFREGQHFVIPSGQWSVIDECSGIRYLMATVMVGSLFAYLNYQSAKRRAIFIAVSVVVPIVANWLRAYLIVMLAHLSDNRLATGIDHILYGWVFFGIVIMALFFVGARWAEGASSAATVSPQVSATGAEASTKVWHLILVAGLAVTAARWPLLLVGVQPSASSPAAAVQLPARLSGRWQADTQDLTSWRPIYAGPSVETQRTFAAPEGRVWVHLAYYRHESQAGKLVSSVNVLVPMQGGEWKQVSAGRESVELSNGSTHWQTAELAPARPLGVDGQRLTVWKAYWIGGRLIDRDVEAKFWQAWLRLRGEPGDGFAIVLAAADNGAGGSQLLLRQFVGSNLDLLSHELAGSRARQVGREPTINESRGG